MHAAQETIPAEPSRSLSRNYYSILAVCLVLLAVIYRDTFESLIHLWLTSDTFAHGIFIGPIALYLIYERRGLIAKLNPQVSWIGLAALTGAGACWWVAFVADVQVVQQLAVVSMIPSLVLLILGRRVAWQIAFPLGFLFLAVPFGEFLTPRLIDFTADFVVSALRWSGIPVFRDGTHFVIPSGRWSVVSGCSGMRYLMATITVAALFSYWNYVTVSRRVLFLAFAILLAVIGNWLRAYGIVMIAHLSDMKLALGIDHYIYGWVFFGIIIFVLMAIGRLWQEELPNTDSAADSAQPDAQTSGDAPFKAGVAATLGILALLVWPAAGSYALASAKPSMRIPTVAQGDFPSDWAVADAALTDWTPTFEGETKLLANTFDNGTGRIGLFLAWYGQQQQGAEVVNAQNILVWEKDERWRKKSLGNRALGHDSIIKNVIETELSSSGEKLLVWQWYWNGGRSTIAPHMAKLHQVASMLAGRGSAGASIIIYTPVPEDEVETARQRLSAFIESCGPNLQNSLHEASEN